MIAPVVPERWSPLGVMPALCKRQLFRVAPMAIMGPAAIAIMLVRPSISLYVLMFPLIVNVMMMADPYEYAVPASPRQLYVTRVLIALLMGWTPALVWACWAESRSGESYSLAVRASLVAVLFVHSTVQETTKRWTHRWAPSSFALLMIGVWSALSMVWAYVSSGVAMVVIGAMALASVVALGREYLKPSAFPAMNALARGDGGVTGVKDRADENRAHFGVGLGWRDAIRLYAASMPRYLLWIAPIQLILLGNASSELLFPLSMIPSLLFQPLVRLGWLVTVPVSVRTRVALMAALPVCITLLLGVLQTLPVGIGHALSEGAPVTRDAAGKRFASPTRIPLTYWQRADAVVPAVITAPWGETVAADTTRVGRIRYLNPFTVRRESSTRFVQWQHDRMTKAVFGHVVSREAVLAERVPLRITQRWRMLILQGAIVMSWLLLMAAAQVMSSPTWSAASFLFMLPVCGYLWEATRGFDHGKVLVPLLQRGLLQVDAALPNGMFVIALAAVPVALALSLLWYRVRTAQLGEQFTGWLAMHGLVK